MHVPITAANAASAIDAYLQLCEDRELAAAETFWAPAPLRMEFPGGSTFESFAALTQDAATRYRWVRKHRDRFLVGTDTDSGALTITSIGRLYGENLDGVTFSDVRYVDVFTVRGGAIAEQLVWNDLAERGALGERRTPPYPDGQPPR